MTEKEKMLAGLLYDASDPELVALRSFSRRCCRAFNREDPEDAARGMELLAPLLGSVGKSFCIQPTFRCDYGFNIHLGDRFYANHDLIILDVCPVSIGSDCLLGPRVCLITATHPMDATLRASGVEYGAPVSMGDRVWIGAGVLVLPGVHIGSDAVIGAGAVVCKDVPDGAVVAGVPARPIR
jgi:maltose O-acetyltransferase